MKIKFERNLKNLRVLFDNASFAYGAIKTNVLELLKQFGIDEVVSV